MSANGRYRQAGVDYDVLDTAKRQALAAAAGTVEAKKHDTAGRFHSVNPEKPHDVGGHLESQGESAFVFRANGLTLASVLECVGTKSIIARAYQESGGGNLFKNIGIDGVAAAVNDLICVRALPLVVHAYFATGETSWYDDEDRFAALVEGWREGCVQAGAVWGGGESPTLAGLVSAGEIEIAGSAVGFIPHGREPLLGELLDVGDEIVLVASSGLHTNGATLAREVATGLGSEPTRETGWRTEMPSGREFGAAVLEPALIYTSLVADLSKLDVAVTYYSHITGHGLRKVMRAHKDLTYRLTSLPEVPEVLAFIQEHSHMSDYDAYGTLNMGAGFAVYCRPGEGKLIVSVAEQNGLQAFVAGTVEKGERRVILEPLGIIFEDDELCLRHTA